MSTPREEEIKRRIEAMTPAQMSDAIKALEKLEKLKREGGQFRNFVANPKQLAILNSTKRIITIQGGNRSSKTHGVAYLDAIHATGLYPETLRYWGCREDCQYYMENGRFREDGEPLETPYTGVKFHEAPKMGIVSVATGQMIKGIQGKLFGPPHAFGTGLIPKDLIMDYKEIPQTNGCLDWALVKHSSGGMTKMDFMNYSQDVKQFQGFDWQYCHFDEQPPYPHFDEVRMRMLDKGGYMLMTFIPRDGQTELLSKLEQFEEKTPEYYDSFMLEWQDNFTLNDDMVKMSEETMTDEEKMWRKYGRQNTSEGRIFPWDKEIYVIEPFELERYWRRIAGLDVGYGHATGAVSGAYDDQANILYIYGEYFNEKSLPAVHASALRQWGDLDFWIDTSSRRISPTDGKRLYDMYREEGLNIKDAETRGGTVMTSINMLNAMYEERRIFIFSTCTQLIKQIGMYRRRRNDTSGKIEIVKKNDDCFVGETRILVRGRGWVEIKNLVGEEFEVWTPIGWRTAGNVKQRPSPSPILKAIISGGGALSVTPEHEVLVLGKGFIPLRDCPIGSILVCGGNANGCRDFGTEEAEVQWDDLLQMRSLFFKRGQTSEGRGRESAIAQGGLGILQWTNPWSGMACPSQGSGSNEQSDFKPGIDAWARSSINAYDTRTKRMGQGEHKEGNSSCTRMASFRRGESLALGTDDQDPSRNAAKGVYLRGVRLRLPGENASAEEYQEPSQVLFIKLQDEGISSPEEGSPLSGGGCNSHRKNMRGLRDSIQDESTKPIEALLPTLHYEVILSKEEGNEDEWVYDLTVDDAHCFFADCGVVVSNCIDPLRYLTLHIDEARVPGRREKRASPKIEVWSPVDRRMGF